MHIVIVDCGMKHNMIREFLDRGVKLTIVPFDYNFNEIDYDGLFVSNGPGNPQMCTATITNLVRFIEDSL